MYSKDKVNNLNPDDKSKPGDPPGDINIGFRLFCTQIYFLKPEY